MDNTATSTTLTPKLWNPNSATLWSLPFTPIFGAWLHAKNWKELEQPLRAKKSMYWVYGYFVFIIISMYLTDNAAKAIGLAYLIAWNFISARGQIKYIKENNIHYEKKKWWKPISIAVVASIIFVTVTIAIASATTPSIDEVLESESVSIVTQIYREQLNREETCKSVTIKQKLSGELYDAVAFLDTGNTVNISIEIKNDQILVSIPEQ